MIRPVSTESKREKAVGARLVRARPTLAGEAVRFGVGSKELHAGDLGMTVGLVFLWLLRRESD